MISPPLPSPVLGSPSLYAGRFGGITFDDLHLSATLRSGQVFRWTQTETGGNGNGEQWQGTVGPRLVRLSQNPNSGDVFWEASGTDRAEAETAVRSFLRLGEVDLPALARAWCKTDALFAQAWAAQGGVRILRQHPDECFFSFLCASVAPIVRISQMLHAVAKKWGRPFAAAQAARRCFPMRPAW